MVLARPKSSAQNDEITKMLTKLNNKTASYWFGVFNNTMRANGTYGYWMYDDGTVVSDYSNWGPGRGISA